MSKKQTGSVVNKLHTTFYIEINLISLEESFKTPMKRIILLLFCCVLSSQYAFSQTSHRIPLSQLDEFENPGKNWILASDVSIDLNKSTIKLVTGKGVLVNQPVKGSTNLVSKTQIEGDSEISFEFMTSRQSSSALYIFGRYKILLTDSWSNPHASQSDLGTLEVNSSDNSGFNFVLPYSKVEKAPGLWQHMRIKFRAPEFDASGIKTKNARYEEVYLNGILIHQDIAVTGPSKGSLFNDESTSGPIVLLADEARAIAFRNISYHSLAPYKAATVPENRWAAMEFFRPTNPILLNPDTDPYLLRSYLVSDNKKYTHVISVGNPNQTNFSYDLKQGSILQFWRGQFVDVTEMWVARGEPQLAKPLGTVTALSPAPTLAVLNNIDDNWPDSIDFDTFKTKGYSLDIDKNPTFHYEYGGFSVDDKISMDSKGEALKREINVRNVPPGLHIRLASAKLIESMGKGLYAIDGKSYYIKIDQRLKPIIRKAQHSEELLIPISKSTSSLEYSIIF